MFILDSLMISGIKWALQTTLTAAEAEMNDDTALRERLLEAEMRREMGEISDEAFSATEADLLARIREIRERREGTAPLELGAEPMQTTADGTFTVEAELSGDYHEPLEGSTIPPEGAGSTRAAGAAPRPRAGRSTGGTVTSAAGATSRRRRTTAARSTIPAASARTTARRAAAPAGSPHRTRTGTRASSRAARKTRPGKA